MKTHGEVQAAIDAGKQLQTSVQNHPEEPITWEDVSAQEARAIPILLLRIKPEQPERYECWTQLLGPDDSAMWVYRSQKHDDDVHLREVRPGDLTREEVEDRIKKARVLFGIPPDALEAGLRCLFLGEEA